ncbi:related to 2,4-dihydroxyhept-2-ene-1,7-dioic acid aldolase [Fusarium fujikuroi]|nr:related to 2,4-dihydroxyhept-2-ene-1,7-dioic acid aldolase [Fusarium fujikuroi]
MLYTSALTTTIQNPQLRLLNALHANKRPIMTFLGLPSTRTAQLVASTGLDGVIIDCEHGHISDDSMHNAVMAIASQGVSPLVRLRMAHADLIKRALDAGAHGIVVPMINTPEDARNAVQHAKFPPQGLRGQGSAFPGFAFGVDIPTYMTMANETILICLQIESKLGVENVDAICAVPGVDMLFIGPNDLALSILGYAPARGDEPEFSDAIEKIIAVARKHGKWIGRLSNDGDSARKHLEIFDIVALGYDIRAIQNWYLAELKSARSSE